MHTLRWFSLAAAIPCVLFGCMDRDLAGPETETSSGGSVHPIGLLGAPTSFDLGCARFEITLSGSTGITVTTIAQPSCGPVVPVISGTPTFSRSTGVVQLPVALANQGTGKYQPSVWLLGWVDSIQQVTPAPPPALSRTFQSPDSVVADNAQQFPKARIWKYDTLLRANSAQLQRLDAGRTSRSRPIKIKVASTITKFRVQFRGRAGVVDLSVPATPPDSISGALLISLFTPSNMAVSGADTYFPQDVVSIGFRESATPTEKQAAVDMIDGEVLGGDPVHAGAYYYVRFSGDGTVTKVDQVIQALKTLPQVHRVTVLARAGLNYLAPNDGTNWNQWQVSPVKGNGRNWALEAVAAPLAWGCEVGDSSLQIGVADLGFLTNADLSDNLDPTSQTQSSVPNAHGTRVASIIAARGANGQGMTGMMWRAKLKLLSYNLAPQSILPNRISHTVLRLAQSGVPIINVSSGMSWASIAGRPPKNVRGDTLVQQAFFLPMLDALKRADSLGFKPLVVFAAGNDGPIDAWWTGFPEVQDSFPGRVLVVAAFDSTNSRLPSGTLAAYSNTGLLVHLAAPGSAIYSLGSTSLTSTVASGTSVAAPIVTGIAGLLRSAHPNMPADSLKHYILLGATRDGRRMSNVPVANAYESLKAAAERTGGPLCGNRMWMSGSQIIAKRGAGQEVLKDVGSAVSNLSVVHGGRDVLFDWQSQALHYDGSAWQIASPPSDTLPGGLERSVTAVSHGGDSLAYYQVPGGSTTVRVFVKKGTAANPATPLATLPISTTSGPTVCLAESSRYDANNNYIGRECDDNQDLSTLRSPWSEDAAAQEPAIAYSPMGDEIVVTVPIVTVTSYGLGAWYTCTWGLDYPPLSQQCRRVVINQAITGATVYGIKVAGGSVRTIWTHSGGKIYWVGIAEAAQQFVTTTGTYNWTFGFFSSQADLYIESRNRGACSFNFLDGAGQATEPAIPVGPDCSLQVGTVAPIRWAGN